MSKGFGSKKVYFDCIFFINYKPIDQRHLNEQISTCVSPHVSTYVSLKIHHTLITETAMLTAMKFLDSSLKFLFSY